MTQKTKTLAIHKATNYFMLAFILALALFYVYFANTTVWTLTILEDAEEGLQSLSIRVGEMESKKLLIENKVSARLARELGFVEVTTPTFITKNSKKTTLSFNASRH